MWDKVFKIGQSKIRGRQLLKNFTWSILGYFASCVHLKILNFSLISAFLDIHALTHRVIHINNIHIGFLY